MLLFGVLAATATAANVPVYGAYNYGQNGQYVINGQATNVRYVDRYVEPEPEKVIQYVDRYIEEPRVPPPAPLTPTRPPSVCRWLNWGAWNECVGLCGHGQQKRIRRCLGGVSGEPNCCPGDDCDYKPCNNPVGDTCAYWSGWTEWGQCSTTCGAGERRKQRTCYGKNIEKGKIRNFQKSRVFQKICSL